MGKQNKEIDWTQFEKDVKEASERAAHLTDAQLASKLASVTSLTQREIQEIFPKPSDVAAFAELMKIVKSSTDRNNKINQIVANSEKFAGIIISLLNKII